MLLSITTVRIIKHKNFGILSDITENLYKILRILGILVVLTHYGANMILPNI